MRVLTTSISGVLLLEPCVHSDERGFFLESFNQKSFKNSTGLDLQFVQDNHSRSAHNVLRGLHYQVQRPQGKLVRVVRGRIFDVAVDIRSLSPTFGQWVGVELTEHASTQLWIPPGFAHGFQVLSASADVIYKTTEYYAPDDEACIAWDDPTIAVQWPLKTPILSGTDKQGALFAAAFANQGM
ncbi:MAG: dTDP-4-dehydrorhamnose 3,5-epimerase [Pseudomonadota bacterium]